MALWLIRIFAAILCVVLFTSPGRAQEPLPDLAAELVDHRVLCGDYRPETGGCRTIATHELLPDGRLVEHQTWRRMIDGAFYDITVHSTLEPQGNRVCNIGRLLVTVQHPDGSEDQRTALLARIEGPRFDRQELNCLELLITPRAGEYHRRLTGTVTGRVLRNSEIWLLEDTPMELVPRLPDDLPNGKDPDEGPPIS